MPAFPKRSKVDAGERAYAYAKACGIIGKSFVGKRISALGKLNALNEFGRLVFPEAAYELPGRELLVELERRLLQRTIRHILAVIDSYSNPPELLVRQLRSCEYADLKTCLRHIAADKPIPATLCDIGKYGTVRFKAYPDLKAMIGGTEFEFILSKDLKAANFDINSLEAEIDLQYYTLLMKSLQRLPAEDRLFAQRILAEEISLRNCVWALRLRTYFEKTSEETEKYLMNLEIPECPPAEIPGDINSRFSSQRDADSGRISLAQEAFESLYFPLDARSAWKGWRWESLLNPEEGREAWTANPRFFQNAASRYIYRLSMRCFRRLPFSVNAEFCYIKLKHFEEDLLTSVAEGLGLGMGGNDVFNLLEVPA
ncbi:MAG: V-type ATPase subunit [Treponema sp.]|jgi:vacuolar-type H+-ATPase subunit C/Vma6|nr:V-type ATPase subunit [Treponema sp.]